MPGMVFPNFEREAELIHLPETEMLRVALNNSSNQIEQKENFVTTVIVGMENTIAYF